MGLVREFLLILVGGAVGAALGTGFGALVGVVSPEFMEVLTHPHPVHAPERVGAAMGMVGGLLVGAAAMAAGRLIGAARWWAGIRDSGADAEPGAAADRPRAASR